MKALITGASSGIGYDIAKYLGSLGYDLIVVARRKDRLELLQKEVKTKVKIIPMDLSNEDSCYELYKAVTDDKIDILVNNAGFGTFGEFAYTDLNKELEMINVNIKTVHILTKLFLKDMKKRNRGYILNVASSAAFQPGPLMATYYATKAYILRLTTALYEELRRTNSKVVVSVLCPGPVMTEFNDVAKVKFAIKSLSSAYVAEYGINKMFNKKLIIIPGIRMKFLQFLNRFLSTKAVAKITYNIQKRKTK